MTTKLSAPGAPSKDPAEAQFTDMVRNLRFRDLQFLHEIATTHSLSEAASRTGMTQPAASRLLSGIEKSLRSHLFERHRQRGMTLTAAGSLAIAYAKAVLADLQTLADDLSSLRTGRKGELRIGSIPFVSSVLVHDMVLSLVSGPFSLTVSLNEAETPHLVDLVRSENLDAAIARCSAKTQAEDLVQIPLFRQRACLVAHPTNPLCDERRISASDLRNNIWVLPPRNSPTRVAMEEAFLRQGLSPPPGTVETASSKLIYSLVSSQSNMLALTPAEIGRELETLGGVRSIPLPIDLNLPWVGLIYLRRHKDSPIVIRVRETLLAFVARGVPLD